MLRRITFGLARLATREQVSAAVRAILNVRGLSQAICEARSGSGTKRREATVRVQLSGTTSEPV